MRKGFNQNQATWWMAIAGACLLFLTGCTTITNLTPGEMARNEQGLYPFEAAWATRQQSLRGDSIQPYVVIGLDAYPMRRTPLVLDRWETLVPIPASKRIVTYRYKFDFKSNSLTDPKANSKMSDPYQLRITEGDDYERVQASDSSDL